MRNALYVRGSKTGQKHSAFENWTKRSLANVFMNVLEQKTSGGGWATWGRRHCNDLANEHPVSKHHPHQSMPLGRLSRGAPYVRAQLS